MARTKERERVIHAYYLYMLVRELFRRPLSPKHAKDFEWLCEALQDDTRVLCARNYKKYIGDSWGRAVKYFELPKQVIVLASNFEVVQL